MFADHASDDLDPRFVARLRAFADEPLATFDPARVVADAAISRRQIGPVLRFAAAGLAAAAVLVAALVLTARPTVAPSTGSGSAQAIAADQSFPADYLVSSGWRPITALSVPGGPFASVDEAVAALRTYFAAAVRPVSEDAVTITVPPTSAATKDVRVFVQILGGTNPKQAGDQFRVWLRRSGDAWRIDTAAEAQIFCRAPLSTPAAAHSDAYPGGGLCY
jgi:hypothetical protein